MIYEPFSLVAVPFPFTDKAKTKKRPAVVVSTEKFQKETGHTALLMVTSASHSAWFGDLLIADLKITGLPIESTMRQKLFTIDLRLIEKKIGHLAKSDIDKLKKTFRQCVAL
ncbi:MAG: type II toxin-antitoxin system PemK/MazF family toxin [Coxiellaceae bacterium]|nr:type II toxin-antitoxin system PemK/MazF family toxin [Coxiellaceae bacterium]